MQCYLPVPYPDELLYSVIARYMRYSGLSNHMQVVVHLFGRFQRASVDLPGSLSEVSKRCWPDWKMSGEDIVNRLTILPYYTRYMSRNRRKRCMKLLLSNNASGIHALAALNSKSVKTPRYIRFCPSCRKNDMSKYGETYWRRSHQLSGVLVCPEHGKELHDSKAFFRPALSADYCDATSATAFEGQYDYSILDDCSADIAREVAKRCQEMLNGSPTKWSYDSIAYAYRQAARERGFMCGAKLLSSKILEETFAAFYGDNLLSKIGCEIKQVRNNWVRCLLQNNRKSFSPAQHALIQIFLERMPIVKRVANTLIESGPWKCPNRYAQHEEIYPIRKSFVRLKYSQRHTVEAYAKCSCGVCFAFDRTSDNDAKLPLVKKITRYGPTWTVEAKRQRQKGLIYAEIAQNMSINLATACRLVKTRSAFKPVSADQISEWRLEWLAIIKKVRSQGRKFAIKKNHRLYARLLRHDRDWLLATSKKVRQINLERAESLIGMLGTKCGVLGYKLLR